MLTILLVWLFSLLPQYDHHIQIDQLFAMKQNAVNTRDMAMFLDTIYQDKHYQQEQKRWFLDAISYIDPHSFRLRIKKLFPLSPNKYRVEITQSYKKNNRVYTVNFPVVVKKTTGGWKDADTLSYQLKQGSLLVKYTDPMLKEQAKRALLVLSKVSDVLLSKYSLKSPLIEVKLYHHPEWFRQSVKLSLPTWAGGWNEARQSIKLVVGPSDVDSLTHGLAHEYTHQLVSSLTNDNAAYWLQEGAAMYYEALLSGEKPKIEAEFKPYSINQLEQLHLEQLSDNDAYRYYLSCYVQFDQLLKIYGEKRIQQVFNQLHRFPYIDIDSAMKQKETNYRTSISLEVNKVFPRYKDSLHDTFKEKMMSKYIL